jgi:hypothetical protein
MKILDVTNDCAGPNDKEQTGWIQVVTYHHFTTLASTLSLLSPSSLSSSSPSATKSASAQQKLSTVHMDAGNQHAQNEQNFAITTKARIRKARARKKIPQSRDGACNEMQCATKVNMEVLVWGRTSTRWRRRRVHNLLVGLGGRLGAAAAKT